MNATAAQQESVDELERLVGDIAKLESIVAHWDEGQALTVTALKTAIEDLNKEAFKRLIRKLKDDEAAGAKLREVVGDSVVYGVLLYHGLVKEPLRVRVEKALAEVRPMLEGHGGDVELVDVKADAVDIRLLGSCHGCPASSQTLAEGVERSIKEHCPEIEHVNQVSRGGSTQTEGDQKLYFISPFAANSKDNWKQICKVGDISDRSILACDHDGYSLLLYRSGDTVSCVENRCAHLGMPLEMGDIVNGVITCPYHGFQYLLETGECLTVPEVQLKVHGVRVVGDGVEVRTDPK